MRIIEGYRNPNMKATLYSSNELQFVIKPGDIISSIGNNFDPIWSFYYASNGSIYPMQVNEYRSCIDLKEFLKMNDNDMYFEDLSINCTVFEEYDITSRSTKTTVTHLGLNGFSDCKIVEYSRGDPINSIFKGTLETCLMYYFKNNLSDRDPRERGHFFDLNFEEEPLLPIYDIEFKTGDTIQIETSDRRYKCCDSTILSIQTEFKDGIQKVEYNLENKSKLITYNDLYHKTMSIRRIPSSIDNNSSCFNVLKITKLNGGKE